MSDKAYDFFTKLRNKYRDETVNEYGDPTPEVLKEKILQGALMLVVLSNAQHRTKLEDGAVEVLFTGNFGAIFKEETDAVGILKALAPLFVGVGLADYSQSPNPPPPTMMHWYRTFAGSGSGSKEVSSLPVPLEELEAQVQAFCNDPLQAIPAELRAETLKNFAKKAKSINKRIRNYDAEEARRNQGRVARAKQSLAEILSRLDPQFRELAVQALRINKTTLSQYETKTHTLDRLIFALSEMTTADRICNYQDEEVIEEAMRLADVKWVMRQ